MGEQEQLDPLHLQAAFTDFEVASNKLAAFYQNLETQVSRLRQELLASRAAEVQQLREKELVGGRLQNLLEALPAGVVVLTGDGCISEFNPAAGDLLGEIGIGQPWIEVVERAFDPQWDDGHDISLKDGRRVNISTQALSGEPGQILLLKDVSDTRRLQELLIHHRRMSAKTELAAALAHQIRTPLATAMLHTANLSATECDNDGHKRAAQRTLDSMRQLERLVEDMLTFARAGKLETKQLPVRELVDRLMSSLPPQSAENEFSVSMDCHCPTLIVEGNVEALVSVMMNLVNNARNAMDGSGELTIEIHTKANTIEFVFSDNGPGIAERDRAHIFEPFYTTSPNGTGLGLAVAKSIVQRHGGELSLETEHTTGAQFLLTLPVYQSCESASSAVSSSKPAIDMLEATEI